LIGKVIENAGKRDFRVQKRQTTDCKVRLSSGCQKYRQWVVKDMKGVSFDRQEGVKSQVREWEKTGKKGV